MLPNRSQNLSLQEADVRAFVGLPDEEDRARAYAEYIFDALNPQGSSTAAMQAAQDDVERADRDMKSIEAKLDETDSYGVVEEPDSEHKRNPIETLFGGFSLLVLFVTMLTVPGIAVMLITQAQKIALVADMPVFGLVFGVTALAGVLASVEFRAKLTSDRARLLYDRRLLLATVTVFIVWASITSLAAYPMAFGDASGATASDWTLEPAMPASPGFVLEPPMWLLFLVTAILDLVAAPTLHQFALRRLTPRTLKRIIPDAEEAHLLVLMAEAKTKRDQAIEALNTLEAHENSHLATKAMQGELAAAAVKRKSADVDAAQKAAAAEILYAPVNGSGNGAFAPNDKHVFGSGS